MQQKTMKKRIFPRIFIGIGIMIIVVTGAIEASHYPWLALLSNRQTESEISDPKPIILSGVDENSRWEIKEELAGTGAKPDLTHPEILPGAEEEMDIPSIYVQLGIIKIPKINVSEFVLEGTQGGIRYGVGHEESTEGIGEAGNCVIAGHRNTHFRYLNKLSAGDWITIKAAENKYIYEVYEIFEVLPEESWVLSDVENEEYVLTLITCTPYTLSTERLIVRARLLNINGIAI